MPKFTRSDIRKILGDAHTDEIENQIMALHLGVVDSLKDDISKYKTDAEKLPDVQAELDKLKDSTKDGGDAAKIQKAFDDYKAEVAAKEAKNFAFLYIEGEILNYGLVGENHLEVLNFNYVLCRTFHTDYFTIFKERVRCF